MMNFLDRLAKALNLEEISNDVGVDLQTETLLLRAEQLARLENEKLADKVTFNYLIKIVNQSCFLLCTMINLSIFSILNGVVSNL